MFEEHKKRKAEEARFVAEEKSKQDYLGEVAVWEHQLEGLHVLLAMAQRNIDSSASALMLKKDELLLVQAEGVGLVEDRRGAGHWQGASQGVSFPIGKIAGRSVRYRVGTTRGHFVQGQPVPTMVDKGTMSITNQRIVFQGTSKSIECAFAKLLGIQHSTGEITVSVSNRQKPTVLYFGPEIDDKVSDRLGIAIGLFHGEGEHLQQQLEEQIRELEAQKPREA